MSVLDPIVELVRGLFTSGKIIFEKPVTYQYPEQKREVRPRFRGRHVLKRYDNGLEKCIGCSLCAAACPADAIFVEASDLARRTLCFNLRDQYVALYLLRLL